MQSWAERVRRGVDRGHGTGNILEVDLTDLVSHWLWGGRWRTQVSTGYRCQA